MIPKRFILYLQQLAIDAFKEELYFSDLVVEDRYFVLRVYMTERSFTLNVPTNVSYFKGVLKTYPTDDAAALSMISKLKQALSARTGSDIHCFPDSPYVKRNITVLSWPEL